MCSASKAANIDFSSASLGTNNVGGLGPDAGAEEMRYQNILPATDLVVTAVTPLDGKPNTGAVNNMKNGFGSLIVRWGTTTDFQFQFVQSGTATPVVIEEYHMAFFDMDKSGDGAEVLSGQGYKGYVTDADTSLAASILGGGRTEFTGTQSVPNPTSPGVATEAQRKASVMFFFKNSSSFIVNFGYRGSQGTYTKDGEFALLLFSGSSVLVDRCSA